MSHTKRVLAAALLIACGLASACSGAPTPSIAACVNDEGCPSTARCTASACVENSPPVARFTIVGDLRANSMISLDATSSSDPDEGDSILSYAWRITSTDAACPLPTLTSTARQVSFRFGCAGHYDVSLSVIDEMHAESEPYTQTLEVSSSSGSGLVETGPDQAVEHTCSGDPLVCRPASAIQLSATLRSPSFPNVRWTVMPPPGREIGPGTGRRISFLPSANVLDPTVQIETDGVSISGDWDFLVEVLDGTGVLDSAIARVSIGNRPPEIGGGPEGPFDHQYEILNHSFVCRNSFPVLITDPDGDPVTLSVRHQHTGDGSASFSAWPIPAGETDGSLARVGFDILAHTSGELLGEGIQRTVVVDVNDVNGGNDSSTFELAVGNQPPALVEGPDAQAAHSFDVQSYLYISSPKLGRWVDPDGDPLTFDVTADHECPYYTPDQGTLRLHCSAGAPLLPFLRSRQATVAVGDPWTQLEPVSVAFRIGNRAPVAYSKSVAPRIACERAASGPNCETGPAYLPPFAYGPIAITATGIASDPDGDPLEIESPQLVDPIHCGATVSCSMSYILPQWLSCSTSPGTKTASFVASDGVESTQGTITVSPICR